MTRYWTLREELYKSLHRWPVMIVFFALGCLLGWATSYIWPSYFRATSQIYVALNPYRTYSDTKFLALVRPNYSNIDNYHYWQMSQLDAAIFLDDFIQETLTKLRQIDPYWENTDVNQLKDMLDAEWRSAGTWSLIAQHPDSEHATQAVQAWGEVIIERIKNAVLSAKNTFMLDQELQAITDGRTNAHLRLQELSDTKNALIRWQETTDEFPEDEPLPPDERWHIISLASRPAQFTPAWMAILEDQPLSTSPPEIYNRWIDQITPHIDNEITSLQQRLALLDRMYNELSNQYASESHSSLGLSPNIEIEGQRHLSPQIVRPASYLTLIGGMIGLLIWILTQLVIITNRAQNQ